MELNFVGIASALSTFVGVWLGHVSVRKIERQVERIWIPSTLALALGLGLEIASIRTSSLLLSAMLGILGVTLLWDALEFYRQQKRIKEGHAPANPHNPRHARILATYPAATTLDWLDRNPRGIPCSNEEITATKEVSR